MYSRVIVQLYSTRRSSCTRSHERVLSANKAVSCKIGFNPDQFRVEHRLSIYCQLTLHTCIICRDLHNHYSHTHKTQIHRKQNPKHLASTSNQYLIHVRPVKPSRPVAASCHVPCEPPAAHVAPCIPSYGCEHQLLPAMYMQASSDLGLQPIGTIVLLCGGVGRWYGGQKTDAGVLTD